MLVRVCMKYNFFYACAVIITLIKNLQRFIIQAQKAVTRAAHSTCTRNMPQADPIKYASKVMKVENLIIIFFFQSEIAVS